MASEDRPPRTSKGAAVEMWEDALEELPEGADYAETLRAADIHDAGDRMEIEELIEHEVPDEHYLALHDAWDDLNSEFEGWWS